MSKSVRVGITAFVVVGYAFLAFMEPTWQARLALQQLENSDAAVRFGRHVAQEGYMGMVRFAAFVTLVATWFVPIRNWLSSHSENSHPEL